MAAQLLLAARRVRALAAVGVDRSGERGCEGVELGFEPGVVGAGWPRCIRCQMVFRRLIRDVTCRLLPGDHRDAQSAKTVGQLANVGSASPIPPDPDQYQA